MKIYTTSVRSAGPTASGEILEPFLFASAILNLSAQILFPHLSANHVTPNRHLYS